MTRLTRGIAAVAALLVLSFSLAACSLLPSTRDADTPQQDVGTITGAEDLSGTTWAGSDSDGYDWQMEFQEDGTVGLVFDDGTSFDDASDVWGYTAGTLTISIVFDDGLATFTGPYAAGASSIDLTAVMGEDSWTVTLTPVS